MNKTFLVEFLDLRKTVMEKLRSALPWKVMAVCEPAGALSESSPCLRKGQSRVSSQEFQFLRVGRAGLVPPLVRVQTEGVAWLCLWHWDAEVFSRLVGICAGNLTAALSYQGWTSPSVANGRCDIKHSVLQHLPSVTNAYPTVSLRSNRAPRGTRGVCLYTALLRHAMLLQLGFVCGCLQCRCPA